MRKEILLNSILVLSISCFGSDLISTISEGFACFQKEEAKTNEKQSNRVNDGNL